MNVARFAQKQVKLRCKVEGTPIVLKWTEWPDGEPAVDPTTDGTPVTGASVPVEKTASVKAFLHIIGAVTSGYRRFAEVQTGDCIIDFPLDLYRVTSAGDTALIVGSVVDELAFNGANRALATGQTAAVGALVAPHELKNLSLTFNGATWVQKQVGEELTSNWDAIYTSLRISGRAMLVCKL